MHDAWRDVSLHFILWNNVVSTICELFNSQSLGAVVVSWVLLW